MNKPHEFWIALAAGLLIVFERHREKSLVSRMLISAISGGIGYSIAPDVAAWVGRSETLAVMILTAFGYAIIDLTFALVADRDLARSVLRRWFGRE